LFFEMDSLVKGDRMWMKEEEYQACIGPLRVSEADDDAFESHHYWNKHKREECSQVCVNDKPMCTVTHG